MDPKGLFEYVSELQPQVMFPYPNTSYRPNNLDLDSLFQELDNPRSSHYIEDPDERKKAKLARLMTMERISMGMMVYDQR